MLPGRAFAVLVAAAVLAAAAPASADTFCVDPARPECYTAEEAFAAARDGDRIVLAALEHVAPLASAHAVEVVGAGEGATVLGRLELSDPGAAVADLRAAALDLAGTATYVRVGGPVDLRGTAVLQAAQVDGPVALAGNGADARLHSVLVRAAGGAALEACGGTLEARHVTIAGTGAGAARTCAGGTVRLRDAIVAGTFTPLFDGDVEPADTVLGGADLLDADGRLRAGSPWLDTGAPGGLGPEEWPEDRDRLPRIADGDGDGAPERDPGAFERQPAATPLQAGNLLLDADAEQGGAWALADGFTRERYGAFPFPSLAAGAALGGGAAFFAGGPGTSASATQRVDVGAAGPEIDRGTATVTLSGLLGGYRADADAGALEATFLDPAGGAIATVALAAPTAAERANATTLLPRARTDGVPPLTRAIDVTMRAVRADGGVYDDAYFDNVGLTLSAPGAPPPPPPPGAAGDPPLRPFAGVRAITGLATVSRAKRRIAVRLLCLDATVGRCSAVLTLTTPLRRGGPHVTAGTTEVAVPPGAIRRVAIPLSARALRTVRERRRVKMLLYASARDGQGLTRLSTIPLTVRWPASPRTTPKRPG